MSDQAAPIAAGTDLLSYRLVEKLGNVTRSSVWKAVDSGSGREVAVKILTRVLPRDQSRREAIVREMRQSAALLMHPSLPEIVDIGVAGDTLFLVMQIVDAVPVSRMTPGGPFETRNVISTGALLFDTLGFLHGKGIIHQNINGDSVLLRKDGTILVAGFRMQNLLRGEGTKTAGEDPFSASYFSPEQILNKQLDPRTDIFSSGILLYEILTGRLPFVGANATEITSKIVREQPPSPIAVNPSADRSVMNIIGRCIFKEPMKRFESTRVAVDEMRKLDPAVPGLLERNSAVSVATVVSQRTAREAQRVTSMVVDVASFEELSRTDPERAKLAIARMQQLVGEAVYLFDGTVADPFANILIGEFPAAANAIDAARKAVSDLASFNAGAGVRERVDCRVVIGAGEASVSPTRLIEVLPKVRSGTLFLEERLFPTTGVARGEVISTPKVSLVEAIEPEPFPEAEAVALGEEDSAAPPPVKRKTSPLIYAVLGVVVLALIAGALYFMRGRGPAPAASVPAATATAPPPPPAAPVIHIIRIDEFKVESTDPAVLETARRVRLASTELLRSSSRIDIDMTGPDAAEFSGTVRAIAGGTGVELVPRGDGVEGTPIALDGVAAPAITLATWILQQLRVPADDLAMPAPDAFDQFAEALSIYETRKSSPEAAAAIRKSVALDANFVPAQRLLMSILEEQNDTRGALEAANQVMALHPGEVDVMRKAARWNLDMGNPADAVGLYGALVESDPNDWEALNQLGLYALSVGDGGKFDAAVKRLATVPGAPLLHTPDTLAYAGSIDRAASAFYDVERADPLNPAVQLKIGRMAVLRHSGEIANLELGKLQQSDPQYGYVLLTAYMEADKKNRAAAETALASALEAAQRDHQPYTAAAEVYTILNNDRKAIEALEKAVERGEPTGNYILNSPLFRYLATDPKFLKVREKIGFQQHAVRSKLAAIHL